MQRFFRNTPYRFYFIFLFLVFGLLIAIFTSIINYNLNLHSIRQDLENKAEEEFARKYDQLVGFTSDIENYVAALRNSAILHTFIRSPSQKNYEQATELFFDITSTNPSLMQVRFIDTKGMEKIRIDWNIGSPLPHIVPPRNLQDKSKRYYFIEASRVGANDFWYSRLDLNIEHGEIEVPHKPVLRIAGPVYLDQQFQGIVIVNMHAKEFLKKFSYSPFFHISLVDHDGQYLLHYKQNLSWSRYLQTGHTLKNDFPILTSSILQHHTSSGLVHLKELHTGFLDNLLPKDQAHILLIPKPSTIQQMKKKQIKALFFIIGTILLLSIPLSILISRIPARLNQKIADQKNTLQKYVDLIDTNIITATTNTDGIITDISTAFCKVSGYTRQELIGSKPKILQHPECNKDVKQEVRQAIFSGRAWQGEFHNQTKDGKSYWLDANIFPNRDEDGTVTGYTAIYHDITDKKRIEKISITDELTGLYNRRFFNRVIARELGRAQRDNKILGFAMLDIDYFKQYNDHYGHQKGDEVLQTIGQVLGTVLNRSSDFCFRLGGEEFGIIFSDLNPEEAIRFTESLRTTIEDLGIEHSWGCKNGVITASIGVLSISPGPAVTVDMVYKRADETLYQAKKEGRNRVVADIL